MLAFSNKEDWFNISAWERFISHKYPKKFLFLREIIALLSYAFEWKLDTNELQLKLWNSYKVVKSIKNFKAHKN